MPIGVSITYRTTTSIPLDARDRIVKDAEALNRSRDWWCESWCFLDDTEGSGVLVGDTKLFLPGYSVGEGQFVEVDVADDAFMACRDAAHIIENLAEWSKRYGIAWEVSLEEPIGTVGSEGADPFVLEVLTMLASEGEFDLTHPESMEQRAVAISAKYSSRL